jgi:hypothetical protein
MDLEKQWPEIRKIFRKANVCLVASVSADGFPHMTPIGSLYLRDDLTGYYLERFPQGLRSNLDHCDRVEVIALDRSAGTWFGALLRGRFETLPAMRLRGHAGPRRPATEDEQDRWQRRVRRLRFTKGHGLLWSGMTHARDIRFDAFDPIRLGAMTEALLPEWNVTSTASAPA